MSVELCRACLGNCDMKFSVMKEIVKNGFYELIGIEINSEDDLPKLICQECLNNFTLFLDFKKTVLNSHTYLQEALQKTKSMNILTQIDIKNENFDLNLDTVNNISDDDNLPDITNIKLKTANKTRKRQKLNKKSTKPRIFIEIDPQKINVITLDMDQQINNHLAEANKASYISMPYKCTKCYKGFNFERKLVCHMEKCHKTNSKFVCQICHRTLSNSASYSLHIARHSTLYECRVCFKTYVEKLQAVTHYNEVHGGIVKEFHCKLCSKTFRYKSTLNGHMRSEHDPNSKAICDICNKIFKSKDSLLDHLLIHTGEKNFSCTICSKKFRLRAEVLAHSRSHNTERTHYCAKCDVTFKCQSALKRHISYSNIHGNTQKHICTECGRKFSTTGTLKIHLLLHDKGPKATCTRCAAILPAVAMKYHVKKHNVKVYRNHVCHQCAQRFSSISSLNRHMLIHSGTKPHACDRCDARFTQKSTLNTHVKLVHLKLKRTKNQS